MNVRRSQWERPLSSAFQRAFCSSALIGAVSLAAGMAAAVELTTFSGPALDCDGFTAYEVKSVYQRGATNIRVLMPERMKSGITYNVIYVLPVERGMNSSYGDGLREVKKLDLHNSHEAIFVQASFSDVPWYADSVSNKCARQERYFLEDVIPFVERSLPFKVEPSNRLLLGFSKSGCGAFSLLLRWPHLFGRAAAWDAPLAMQRFGSYESEAIFETQENFEKYRITDLINARAGQLKNDEIRLILIGRGIFDSHMRRIHHQLTRLDIPHHFSEGRELKHSWPSGWLADAVQLLLDPYPGECDDGS